MVPPSDITAARSIDIRRLIAETVTLLRDGNLLVGLCPFHADRSPSLTVWPDHFHCFGCGAHGDAIDWLARLRGCTFREAVAALLSDRPCSSPPAGHHYHKARDEAQVRRRIRVARLIWTDAQPAAGTIVGTYLQHRLQRHDFLIPSALRFHPNCPRGPSEDDRLPAMVALMTDAVSGEPVGVHRTYLRPDGRGKAPIANPKMMLGRAGVVRLSDDTDRDLAVAEGIETALAVSHLLDAGPCWAALSSEGVKRFPVLPERDFLRIYADPDIVGRDAADVCKSRWSRSGRACRILVPPVGSGDWLDAALAGGR